MHAQEARRDAMIQNGETTMSYDNWWDCPSLDPRTWIEYQTGSGPIPDRPFAVSVSHGENCAVDELYLFSTFEDAQTFYSKNVKGRQFKIGGRLLGFQNVALIEMTHDITLAERTVSGRQTRGHRSSTRRAAHVRLSR